MAGVRHRAGWLIAAAAAAAALGQLAPAWSGIPEGTPLFSYQGPTTRADGSPYPEAERGGYHLVCNGSLFATINDWAQETYQALPGDFAPGSYNCGFTAFDTAGRESEVSETVGFSISAGPGMPLSAPASFAVQMSEAPQPPPGGDMQVATGFLTAPVSGDNPASVSVTGLGFQPKALMVYATGRYGFNSLDTSNIYQSVGMTDGTRQAAYWTAVQNNTRTTEFGRDTTKLINMRDHTGADQIVATIGSFDADGFTVDFTVSDAHPGIRYIALGGSALTDVYLANGVLDLDSGSDVISAIGFEPDAVIARTSFFTGGVPNTNGFGLGAAVNGGGQWAMAYRQRDNRNTGGVYDFADEILLAADDSAARIGEANISAWNANGVTLTAGITSAGDQLSYSLLCLKGGQYAIGSFASPTANGNHVESGLPFQPVGLLLASTNETDSPEGATGNPTAQSVGFADGTNQNVVGFEHDGGNNFSTYGQYNTHLGLLADSNGGAPLTEETAQFTSFNSDGFTVNFDLAAANAYNYAYLAFGPAAGGGPVDVALGPVSAVGSLPASAEKVGQVAPAAVDAAATLQAVPEKIGETAPAAVDAAATIGATIRKESDQDAGAVSAAAAFSTSTDKIAGPSLTPLSAVAAFSVTVAKEGEDVTSVALGPLSAAGTLAVGIQPEVGVTAQLAAAAALSVSYGPEDAQNLTPLASAAQLSATAEKTADIDAGALSAVASFGVTAVQESADVRNVALGALSAGASWAAAGQEIAERDVTLGAVAAYSVQAEKVASVAVSIEAAASLGASIGGIKAAAPILSATGSFGASIWTLKQTAAYLSAVADFSVSHFAGFAADFAGTAELTGVFDYEVTLTAVYDVDVALIGKAGNV